MKNKTMKIIIISILSYLCLGLTLYSSEKWEANDTIFFATITLWLLVISGVEQIKDVIKRKDK